MRRQYHHRVPGKLTEDIAEAHTLFWVESRSRLIENNELWVIHYSNRNSETLLHTTRKAAEFLACAVGEVDFFEQPGDILLDPCRVQTFQLSEITQINDDNAARAAGGDVLTDLENVEKSFEQYPALIYDGPFSEHIENRESVMLKNAPQITRSEAQRKAEEFLGAKGKELEFESLSENTAIESYTFRKTSGDDDISISVTKNGGYILYYLNNTDTGEEKYDINSATKAAAEFLSERGYPNMVSSYYEKTDGVATINFAYSQDGVVCYSDLVKVRVALDTGAITGLEAKGYLMNHTERTDTYAALSAEEARAYVSTRLDVSSSGLAIIPKDSMQEVLCYEFHGTFLGKNFLVYVNAANGREEKIFLLIESDDGILTV